MLKEYLQNSKAEIEAYLSTLLEAPNREYARLYESMKYSLLMGGKRIRPIITKAVIETVAENTVDGVLTPIFFLVIGGTPLAMAFKAISTLDSMIGYKNEKYEYFGKFSARMDDIFNFLPARLSVIFFIFSSMITGLDTKNCVRICIRDRKNHLSPNCAYPESLVAGALNIQLGGNHYYSGKLVEKPTIGDDIKSVDEDDIMKTVNLLRISTFMAILLAYYISDKYLSI